MSQNNVNDQSKQSIINFHFPAKIVTISSHLQPVQEDTDLQIAQTEKYGHIKVYEPINEDQIPEEEQSQSESGANANSSSKNRPKSKVKSRPNLFNKKTPVDQQEYGRYYKSSAQDEPTGDNGNDAVFTDNNGEVTEFIGSYE